MKEPFDTPASLSEPVPPSRRPRRRRLLLFFALALLLAPAVLAIQHPFARPDFAGFDAKSMGQIEARMWRDYYEGRWVALGVGGLRVASAEYGFSWWDSLRLAWHSSVAAKHFRHDTKNPNCLPALESYYRIAKRASASDFDPAEAAALELEWWRERRRHVPPAEYALTVARLASLVYARPADEFVPASRLRTEAMTYRDARRKGKMTEDDWQHVARQLEEAHGALLQTLRQG